MVSVHVKCINGQWTSCDANPELRKNFVKNVAFKFQICLGFSDLLDGTSKKYGSLLWTTEVLFILAFQIYPPHSQHYLGVKSIEITFSPNPRNKIEVEEDHRPSKPTSTRRVVDVGNVIRKEGRISDETCALVSMNVLVNSSHQGRSEAPVSFSPISSLLPAKRGARQAIHFPESSLACSPTSLEARENNWQWTRKGWTGDEESAKNQILKESNDCYYDGGADLLANFGSHARTQPLYLFFSAEDSNESDLRLPGQV
ncbi:hypothetical protein EV424DRAFT_1346781 [Suillus variegatus]|nr:hypothetical protein EV424DRAFT_1346781 [Suillus variegatus]